MVLEYFGDRRTEPHLARLAATTKRLGTDASGLARAARHLGFEAHVKDFSTFGDIRHWLKRGVPVIVDWFSKGLPRSAVADGHYSVVVGLDRDSIYLLDPEFGKLRQFRRWEFYRVWFDYKGEYVRSTGDVIVRQIIAIYPRRRASTLKCRQAA